jgi:hypothetical protein
MRHMVEHVARLDLRVLEDIGDGVDRTAGHAGGIQR